MDKEFTDKIENEILTSEILFSCLCAAETAIGKYAVLTEKWRACGNSIRYVFAGNRDCFVRVSRKMWNVLLLRFPAAEIDARLLAMQNVVDKVPENLLKQVYEMLLGEKYVME